MADDIDRAQRINEQFQGDALADARRGSTAIPSRADCLDCEEPIPTARRVAIPGCQRCIDCQAELENDLEYWRTT